jgi:hypothetical protein
LPLIKIARGIGGHKTGRPLEKKPLANLPHEGPKKNDTTFCRVLEKQKNIKYSCV